MAQDQPPSPSAWSPLRQTFAGSGAFGVLLDGALDGIVGGVEGIKAVNAKLQKELDNAEDGQHHHHHQHAGGFNLMSEHNGNTNIASLQWTFAIVLAPAEIEDIPPTKPDGTPRLSRNFSFLKFVLYTCKKINDTGLDIMLVEHSEFSKHRVVLLIKCPEEIFLKTFEALSIRGWKETGAPPPAASTRICAPAPAPRSLPPGRADIREARPADSRCRGGLAVHQGRQGGGGREARAQAH